MNENAAAEIDRMVAERVEHYRTCPDYTTENGCIHTTATDPHDTAIGSRWWSDAPD